MKRQRNIQQVNEHDKCPPNQTKEKEIGNLPERELKIMIVKMIQNLENKIGLQVNSLQMKIEKIQEKFNKDVEEIKKKVNIQSAQCHTKPIDISKLTTVHFTGHQTEEIHLHPPEH